MMTTLSSFSFGLPAFPQTRFTGNENTRTRVTDKNKATTVGAEIVRDGGKVTSTTRDGDKVTIEYEVK